MIAFPAVVSFVSEAEGGLSQTPWSGMKPSYNADGKLIASIVSFAHRQFVNAGHDVPAIVSLVYGERLDPASWAVGTQFQLQCGAQILARGRVTGGSETISSEADAAALADLLLD